VPVRVARGEVGWIGLLEASFASPVHHRATEPALSEGGDAEPAALEGGVRLGVAGAAEGDQAVAIDVRAALRALPDVMHLEAVRGQAAGLAPLSTQRGTAEQWIWEGNSATSWTRLSCHRFRANDVRLMLGMVAYNLGTLLSSTCSLRKRESRGAGKNVRVTSHGVLWYESL
jgi:Transposase DDE domain group 1